MLHKETCEFFICPLGGSKFSLTFMETEKSSHKSLNEAYLEQLAVFQIQIHYRHIFRYVCKIDANLKCPVVRLRTTKIHH